MTQTPSAQASADAHIAYVGIDGNLWITDLAGHKRKLTTHGWASNPAWSPNGHLLAYIYQNPDNGMGQVHLYDTRSGIDTPVKALQDHFLSDVSWSPDSHYLAGEIGCCPEGRMLRIVTASDGQIVIEYGYSLGYAWSPDGEHLALGREQTIQPPLPVGGGNSNSLAIVDVGKRDFKIVLEGTRESLFWPVAWFHDNRILYEKLSVNAADSPGWWEIKIEGEEMGDLQRVQNLPLTFDRESVLSRLPSDWRNAGIGELRWSSDERWVAFHVRQKGTTPKIYVMQWKNGGKPVYLVDGSDPVWQPVHNSAENNAAAESKPGPPPGYVELTPIPTPTMITMPRPADWKEIRLPPPKGSEQIMPKDVSVPTVRLAIPAQWQYTLMPGLYLVTPGPEASPPVLTLGPSLPFADQNETIPQNIQGFVQALERVYQRTHGIADARGQRLLVGGQEGVAIFSPGSEVCVDIFVPLAGRYDVAYKFTFMRSFCDPNQDALTETGELILQSVEFEH